MNKIVTIAMAAGLITGSALAQASKEAPNTVKPTIVTQVNFPQAFTNMRFGAILKKTGGVNKFFAMPVPSSIPAEQFVVRMNRDTPYSVAVIDMSSGDVYVTIPKTDRYVSMQVVDENHETQPMIYGSGRHRITAKTDHAFVTVRALDGDIRHKLVIEAGSAKAFVEKKWDMKSFHAVDKAGNLDFSDGYDQSKAFGNKESGQTAYMNYVGTAGGWGGAMVQDNIYQTSQYFDAKGRYEVTFADPKAKYFWSATVYNGDGRMFNDKANISSEMKPVKNADGTYTLRFGCEGQPNNIPIVEGNTTGKFNVLMRHYGPSKQVGKGEEGYDATKLIRRIDKVSQEVLDSISTPNTVETSIGTLKFLDGAPYPETAQKAYDYLDTMRGVDAFLKGMQGASLHGIITGIRSIGAVEAHQVVIFDKLGDSKPLYLTLNTSTLYVMPTLDLERDGPTVVEMPAGMLGALNDTWFRYVEDFGPAGPDKGKGGKYLVLPPGYEGEVPDGYFVIRPRTYDNWILVRTSIANGLDVAVKKVKDNLRIYPLAKKDNPPAMEFISGSGKSFNTIHANDFTFYEHLNDIIQKEPLDMLDPEIRGLFASIGMEKGKPFAPDARMKTILVDAVAIANASARSIVWYPRTESTMKGIRIYPDTDSAWIMGFLKKNVFFTGDDGKTMNSDARVMFYYPYTVVTPAMALTKPGAGSDYGIAYVDSKKMPFDGDKTYKLHLPPNPPAKDFWAVTMYDPQTRSQLQTSQPFPTVGSQTDGIRKNQDGSYDLYFAPKAPEGYENNWLETIPGKGFFMVLRMYGPEQAWIDKTWRPGEIELVE